MASNDFKIATFAKLFALMLFTTNTWALDSTQATQDNTTANSSKADQGQIWNLQKADLNSIIDEVSRSTGKNFIVDPRVNGKVTIISSKPIKPEDVYSVFLSILQTLGYAAIPSGDVIKIVPSNDAKQLDIPLVNAQNPGSGDEMVVRVIPLQSASASQLVAILRPLMPQSAHIAADQAGNTLVLTGYANNLQRLVEIIGQVDKANTSDIEVIRLQHAVAAEVAQDLSQLKSDDKSLEVTLAANEDTNSIMLSGSEIGRMKLRVLIAELDTPSRNTLGNAQVVYLRYLQAKDFAPILMQTFGGIEGSITGPEGKTVTASSNTSGLNIVAEPNTNSLLIVAPPKEMMNLKTVIAKLDVRPAEVLIEAAIVQIDENSEKSLGIRWGSSGNSDINVTDVTGEIFNAGTNLFNIGRLSSNASEWNALVSALENDSNNNILATPNITVVDNQEAKIEIGQQISITTGSYTGAGTDEAVDPFTTSEYQDVGLHLYVTPQINRGDSVQLKIDQGNSTVVGGTNAAINETNPPLNTETLTTTVIVNNNEILVLGGLIQNQQTETVEKIPLLVDIPFLGKLLFTYTATTNRKTNLMIFLHPTIIHSRDQAVAITGDKYNYMRDLQKKWAAGERGSVDPAAQVLPHWGDRPALPSPFSSGVSSPQSNAAKRSNRVRVN